MDALSSSQLRLEVVVVVAAPVVPAPLRGITNKQVGTVGAENETILQTEQNKENALCLCWTMAQSLRLCDETHQVLQLSCLGDNIAIDNDL